MSETGEPVVHKPGTQHLTHALWAAFWMYGGRAGGMVWTLALVGQLGIADYGKYAMAYAVYSLIGSPIDNLFVVRSVRESEEHFLSDRATRYLLGVGFMAVGLALLEVNYVAAFGLFVSGGELTLKAGRVARCATVTRTRRRRSIPGGSSRAWYRPASTCSRYRTPPPCRSRRPSWSRRTC